MMATQELTSRLDANPHLRFLNRAPYELGRLIQELPAFSNPQEPQSEEIYQRHEAVGVHASNSITTLASGLEAIGALLASNVSQQDERIGDQTLRDIAYLITHLAVEIQHCHEMEGFADLMNDSRARFAAKKGEE